jgi:hypothetical protein
VAPRDTFTGVGVGRKAGSEAGEAIRWGHSFGVSSEVAPPGSTATRRGGNLSLCAFSGVLQDLQTGLRFSTKAVMPSCPSGATALQEIASAIIS